ncbi:hypothetical protein EPI10_015930 [Gossypium australe]|uniref:Uncharacterized protein n=1 Tax=Gossypium australe TaxID=47621 RepID=A0A5B6VM68_9ROSI|nr:hypothetical protein EPI10_015930 [Gossypium australe]
MGRLIRRYESSPNSTKSSLPTTTITTKSHGKWPYYMWSKIRPTKGRDANYEDGYLISPSYILPNNTENNPWRDGKEHVKEIILRSSKEFKPPTKPIDEEEDIPKDVDEPTKKEEVDHPESIEEVAKSVPNLVISTHSTTKIPQKLKDSGSFTILIEIWDQYCSKALCDLGASINLMSLSIYRKIKLEDLKNISIMVQLADRSLVHHKGDSSFPIDFVIIDFDEDQEIPILLGRPFMATSNSMIYFE